VDIRSACLAPEMAARWLRCRGSWVVLKPASGALQGQGSASLCIHWLALEGDAAVNVAGGAGCRGFSLRISADDD